MDILPYLKSHHDAIRTACSRLADVSGVKERRAQVEALARATHVYLMLERDYLFPEVAGLFAGAEGLLIVAQANAAVVDKRLKALVKLVAKGPSEQDGFALRLRELQDALSLHFEQEEQGLMPKMRLLIRTEDREDLGQVFVDAEAEVTAEGLLSYGEAAEVAVVGRKRA